MIPVDFKEANHQFGPPPSLHEVQCGTLRAHVGKIQGGTCDGATIVVTAWKPHPHELEMLKAGNPVYLSVIGGLPPHFVTACFHDATHPA